MAGWTEAEFTDIYNTYRAAVGGFIANRIQDRDLVDDLISETFIKAWVNRAQYSDQGKIHSWLFTVAQHVIADHFRKREHQTTFELDVRWGWTEERFDHYENTEFLDQVFSTLTPDQRAVCIGYARGYSVPEIAESLNLTREAVRALRFRAVHTLSRTYPTIHTEFTL